MKYIIFVFFVSLNCYSEVYSNSYNTCIDSSSGVTPSILGCISNEIKQVNDGIDVLVDEKKKEYPEYVDYIEGTKKTHNRYVDRKCAIYNISGGQSAIILQAQCALNETISYQVYINDLFEILEYQ